MAYTPELSQKSSCTLRRIAWALNIPMTQAIERVFEHIPKMLDKNKVCGGCKDKTKCNECSFNQIENKGGSIYYGVTRKCTEETA